MGRLGVGTTRAHLVLLVGMALVVAGVYLLGGVAIALVFAGGFLIGYALLLVDVSPAPAAPVPGDVARVGR